jgi:hypothetical protein
MRRDPNNKQSDTDPTAQYVQKRGKVTKFLYNHLKLATAMAIACSKECEMEMLISLTPAFLAAVSASPWS